MKKPQSLEKQIEKIMNHYWFDPYNKRKYIADCSKAIVKVVEGMVGEDEEELVDLTKGVRNFLRQEIRTRILGGEK